MPTWGQILLELQATTKEGTRPPDFDAVRRRYLAELHRHTGRNLIVYASKWTQPSDASLNPELISVSDEDMEGLMETVYGLPNDRLDLMVHSPGGSAEAAEALVTYLRQQFRDIRAIVPHAAMSAATMICCGCDRILMGKHSFLGPIDPQFFLNTPLGLQSVPAQAILDQFAQAKEECKDSANLAAWLPMLGQFGPGLLVQCKNALDLSKGVVERWLEQYMFSGDGDASQKAAEIANWLSDHGEFKSHGRHLSRESLEIKGLKIDRLEVDQTLQDLTLSVFHALMHTFSATAAAKIIENHNGKAWVKMAITQQVTFPIPAQIAPPPLKQKN
ncbi:MAG TPA: hypothetical protein VFB00_06560 [Terriglobales bacterium]|nr:hypothetical protein [Terriglobales bacterium]